MGVKVTVPNNSSDSVTFGSANTPTAAEVKGYDDGSSNGHLEFYTTASGTSAEKMRIDSSGNVGIGTSSPSYKLHSAGGTYALGLSNSSNGGVYAYWTRPNKSYILALDINNNGGTDFSLYDYTAAATRLTVDGSGNVGIGNTSPSSTYGAKLAVTGGNIIADFDKAIGFQWSGGLNQYYKGMTGRSLIDNTARGLHIFNYDSDSNRGINFYPNNYSGQTANPAVRIDSSGNLLVGQTATGIQAQNGFSLIQQSGGSYQTINHASGVASGQIYINFGYNGSQIGSITQNGTTATAYNTSSDYRLKENIAPMTGALNVVQQLKPVTYNWKADGSSGQGFIAHELAEVVPDCVTGEKDAVELIDITDEEGNVIGQEERPVYQGIDTSFLVATLTAAIQEQQAIISAQADTIASMEARLTALENK